LEIGICPRAIYSARVNIYEELKWRGLIADFTGGPRFEVKKWVDSLPPIPQAQKPPTVYCGFDPTADSLHVGNLVPLLCLKRFQDSDSGFQPIAVAGGATGMIGDPSGKTGERQLLTREMLNHNIACIKEQLKGLLNFDCGKKSALLLDNGTWTASVSCLDFLRDIGKHFSVNQMMQKDSVQTRMETGISYTEFSYMLLQAYDFMVLCRDHNCELQIGGSDQWGNITAGIDLTRKKLGKTVFGLTIPLITNADGTKFGKTEAGAIWLDPKRTSVYRFYQFWINTADADVIPYLKYFTFLDESTIKDLESQPKETRAAHKALAIAVTDLIHGAKATAEAVRASEILFGGELTGIAESTFNEIVGEVPTKEIEKAKLDGTGLPLVDLLVHAGLCPSKGQARKDIEGGGVNVNNVRETSATRAVTSNDLLFGKHILLRKGKKNYVVVTAK
jgi:tyrosyl-tRNA synthetase